MSTLGTVTALVPAVKTVLDIVKKKVPDKSEQMELEKELLKVNEEIIKSNKKLLEKVIPLTFPIVVWVFVGLPTIIVLGSVIRFWKTGTYYEIVPLKDWLENLFYIVLVFLSGLVGKWNIKKFWKGKNQK